MSESFLGALVSPGQGGDEHVSERASRRVSERAQEPTPKWAARATTDE